MGMTIGERLLDLTVEYQAAKAARDDWGPQFGGKPHGREPVEIAADYETALKELRERV